MEIVFDMEENAEAIEEYRAFLQTLKSKPGSLMEALHRAQETFGYLPLEIQNLISRELVIPLAQIYGVATFYSHFSLEPTGEYEIGLCLGTACYVRGAQEILDEISADIGVKAGETTEDLKFSLQATRCIGACGLAPVMTIGSDVYGNIEPKSGETEKILANYKD